MRFLVRYLSFILPFLSNRWLQVVLDGKSLQENPVKTGAPLGSIFLLCNNELPGICNIAIYAKDTTVYFKCGQTSDLWQQLELASELESELRDTIEWGRKRPVDFNARKTQLNSFDGSNNVNINGYFLEKNHLSRC